MERQSGRIEYRIVVQALQRRKFTCSLVPLLLNDCRTHIRDPFGRFFGMLRSRRYGVASAAQERRIDGVQLLGHPQFRICRLRLRRFRDGGNG